MLDAPALLLPAGWSIVSVFPAWADLSSVVAGAAMMLPTCTVRLAVMIASPARCEEDSRGIKEFDAVKVPLVASEMTSLWCAACCNDCKSAALWAV